MDYLILEEICSQTYIYKMKTSNLHCFIDIQNFFLKKEILSMDPEIFIIYDVYTESDISNILQEAKKGQLMHMFEIYEAYLEDLEVTTEHEKYEYAAGNFTENDFMKLSQTLHFGREGKLYFPQIGSKENVLIESKLSKLGLIQPEEKKTTANLQVILSICFDRITYLSRFRYLPME